MKIIFMLVVLLTACVSQPQPAPLIIPTPDQQNGADRGHAIQKEHH